MKKFVKTILNGTHMIKCSALDVFLVIMVFSKLSKATCNVNYRQTSHMTQYGNVVLTFLRSLVEYCSQNYSCTAPSKKSTLVIILDIHVYDMSPDLRFEEFTMTIPCCRFSFTLME